MEITTIIEKYLVGITSDEFHRYKSWDNCFQAFSASKQSEPQVLELAFYWQVGECIGRKDFTKWHLLDG